MPNVKCEFLLNNLRNSAINTRGRKMKKLKKNVCVNELRKNVVNQLKSI